jgi:hypothetical protein
MNIIILGGGTKGKFGNDFVQQARSEGHRVIVFSHINHYTFNVDDRILNYTDIKKTDYALWQIVWEMPVIDLIVFNQKGSGYPQTQDILSEPNFENYNFLMLNHVIMPHLVISKLYNNLNTGSKVVFIGSTMAFEYDRDHSASEIGYPGAKSFATHLMSSLARVRTKPITFSTLCVHLPYDQPDFYKQVFEKLYNYILTHDDSFNGKIVGLMNGLENTIAEINVKYN